MREALREAEIAYRKGEVPIGAVLVYEDKIIARGHNLRESLKDPTAHAEMIAIRAAAEARRGWRLFNTTLYVTVEPCPMCAGAIVQARIDRLVYGTRDPKAGAVDSLVDLVRFEKLNHQVEVISGVVEEECRDIMQQFFRDLRDKRK